MGAERGTKKGGHGAGAPLLTLCDLPSREARGYLSNAPRLLVEPAVDHVLQPRPKPGAMRDRLGHEHHDHVLLRIAPERGAAGPRPRHLADRSFRMVGARLGSHRKAETEAESRTGQ